MHLTRNPSGDLLDRWQGKKLTTNMTLIDELRELVQREVSATNNELAKEFEHYISVPNYRAAFHVLMRIEKNDSIKKTEYFRNMMGRFWHEVAE